MTPEMFKTYVEVILAERSWSWTVVGIFYLVLGLVIRGWLIGPIIHKAKELNRLPYEEFKRAYLKRAAVGWIFFLLSFVVVVGLWNREARLPLSIKEALAVLAAIVSFLLSILSHLQALGVAAVIALKRVSEKEAGN